MLLISKILEQVLVMKAVMVHLNNKNTCICQIRLFFPLSMKTIISSVGKWHKLC